MPAWDDLPSIKELFDAFPNIGTAHLQAAWNDSFHAANGNVPAKCGEIGGFIYVDPKNKATPPLFKRAPPGGLVNQDSMGTPPVISLAAPPEHDADVKGLILVATFHTHPLRSANREPSDADLDNAWWRQMPGLVISRAKIYAYTSIMKRREDEKNPTGYPPRPGHVAVLQVDPVRLPWYPDNAPNQVLP